MQTFENFSAPYHFNQTVNAPGVDRVRGIPSWLGFNLAPRAGCAKTYKTAEAAGLQYAHLCADFHHLKQLFNMLIIKTNTAG